MANEENADYLDIDLACADFLLAHQEWATPEGARGQCSTASAAFLDLLLERKIITRRGQVTGEWDNEEVAVINGVSHRVARVGDLLIDWTARQFNPNALFPMITTYRRLNA